MSAIAQWSRPSLACIARASTAMEEGPHGVRSPLRPPAIWGSSRTYSTRTALASVSAATAQPTPSPASPPAKAIFFFSREEFSLFLSAPGDTRRAATVPGPNHLKGLGWAGPPSVGPDPPVPADLVQEITRYRRSTSDGDGLAVTSFVNSVPDPRCLRPANNPQEGRLGDWTGPGATRSSCRKASPTSLLADLSLA